MFFLLLALLQSRDAHIAFSGGQDSFSLFTMEMVRQYMKDEEVRLQHQNSLLHLRQKALKEKTRTELAWLEHQKKKLRDKGEDDKMPPIRKKQRGLLLKLQQEQVLWNKNTALTITAILPICLILLCTLLFSQAEIRRLQEANKAARKERQLLLKQQEEIERMRNSTLRLKERLKCAEGEAPPTPVSEPSGTELSSLRLPDEIRSPSPSLSISGSETSSIMQKLKKMRSQMDEKQCSPVHYFFSVFTAHHWASLSVCLPNLHPKFQLFIYNQLVRFLTKREQQLMQRRHHAEELLQWKQQLDQEEAEVRRMEKEALAAWDQRRPQDKDHKTSASDEKDISETGSQASHHQSLEPRSDSEKAVILHLTFSVENISDRSDIESRIKELREELRKRKIMAYQLKKEQKKRHQERLKAQEANLLKQLEVNMLNMSDTINSSASGGVLIDVSIDQSESEDEQSHLLKLDSEEKLTAPKHVPPFVDEDHKQSLSVSLDQEEQKKQNEESEVEEAAMSNTITPGAPYSAVVNLAASPHASCSSSSTDPPLSPDSVGFSLNKDPLVKDVEASSRTDGYHEDFESANSSPREEHISKLESQISLSHTEVKHSGKESSRATPTFDNQDEEEEIPEDMSQHSAASEQNHCSEKLLELQQKGEDLKFDNKTEFSSQEPASPTFILDEMPSFHLGDRVLVGGVQPGTLRFKGQTSFANGFWAGVELDKCEGSNNGTYDGVVYFECEESHGIFAPPDKVSHLLGKFELYADNTEDEDSFFDDLSDKGEAKHKTVKDSSRKREDPEIKSEQTSDKETQSRDEKVLDESDQIPIKTKPNLNSQHQKEPEHRICNGNMKDIILDLNDASNTFLIPDEDRLEEKNEETTSVIGRKDFDVMQDLIPKDQTTEIKNNKREQEERDLLDTFADKLLNNFIKDSFKKCAEIKRVKEEKIRNANQSNGCLIVGNDEDNWISSLKQKDNLPFFLPAEKEELSSPELCNRSVSVFLILVWEVF
ncbi:hypothetical protein XENOCAPTIV_027458 [Xenoophorus captivus]|uniref:CAP-Gly domain-containing protein n=1 Tax=Xenoophorus captivus TaxID=1517983 RepID=A0ABV0S3G3_9TELE